MNERDAEWRRHGDAISELLERHIENQFSEAIEDPDGMVSACVAAEYVDILNRRHNQEIADLGDKLARFGSLDVTMDQHRRLLEKFERLVKEQASTTSEILGSIATMEAGFDGLNT